MVDVYEELQALIGTEEGPSVAGWEVNKAMIQHWCEAMEDGNPLYLDEEYAKKSKYGGIIAPPPMIQTFGGGPRWPVPESGGQSRATNRITEILHEGGYTQTVATTNAWEFFLPVLVGDRLSRKSRFATVSPEKKTRTGFGHFTTNETIYFNQRGEKVAVQSFTTLRFKPPERGKE